MFLAVSRPPPDAGGRPPSADRHSRRRERVQRRKPEDYGLIEAEGEGKGRVYRVVDRNIGPPPGIEIPRGARE